ncbi:MAG: barstar family protein [Clostridia bacterium]|jgi:ribonuclease inhibitor|nr:barstar family protein [Clostridia bacterium]
MKSVFLQGDALTHDALAEAFGFPAYYGRNLDALHDCLGDIGEDTAVIVTDMGSADENGRRILTVLWDSARENPHLSLYLAAKMA